MCPAVEEQGIPIFLKIVFNCLPSHHSECLAGRWGWRPILFIIVSPTHCTEHMIGAQYMFVECISESRHSPYPHETVCWRRQIINKIHTRLEKGSTELNNVDKDDQRYCAQALCQVFDKHHFI